MTRYRKKPVVVEAHHYVGPDPEFAAWMNLMGEDGSDGIQPIDPIDEAGVIDWPLWLHTIQGEWVTCSVGEWIIAESQPGRYYPCADETFQTTYEEE